LFISLPTVVLLALLFELIIFRFIIRATETPIVVYDEQYGILRYDKNQMETGVYTMGQWAQIKARWRVNNYGWNSSIDYAESKSKGKTRICIIGDSYVEALQVDVEKNFVSLLREMMGDDYEVYSFGISGSPLSQYLHISRYVKKIFQPDILVFLLVHNDFDESVAQFKNTPDFLQLVPENDSFTERQPTRPVLRQYLKISATIRYLYSNIRIGSLIGKLSEKKYDANIDVARVNELEKDIRAATDYIIGKISAENSDRKVIFIMDAPRWDIYSNNLVHSNVYWMNNMVKEICSRYGMYFLDLTESFSNDYSTHRHKFNFDIDGHWNEYGHSIAAMALFKYLNDVIQQDKPLTN